MRELDEIRESIKDFYSLDTEKEKSVIIDAIRDVSEKADKDEFIKYVRENFEQKSLSGIGVIYEALSKYPKDWGFFFLSEIKRGFKNATISSHPFEILESLEELSFVNKWEIRERQEIIQFLGNYLSSENDVLRYKAIWLLCDWLDKIDQDKYPEIVASIRSNLNHPNWKIRVCSFYTLTDIAALPSNFKLKMSDNMRKRFFSPFKM